MENFEMPRMPIFGCLKVYRRIHGKFYGPYFKGNSSRLGEFKNTRHGCGSGNSLED